VEESLKENDRRRDTEYKQTHTHLQQYKSIQFDGYRRTLTCEHGLGGGFSQVQGGLAIGVADVGVGSMLQQHCTTTGQTQTVAELLD